MLSSCDNHKHNKGHNHSQQHDSEGHNHDHHGQANAHMHGSSFEELVERFESPKRDTYQQPQKVMDYLGDVRGKKVMDIGAGTGYFSFKLADAGASVIAADVDDQFQRYIGDKKNKLGYSVDQVSLRKIPRNSPSLATGEVDIVLMVNTYHHIEDRVPYFALVRSGLKSGGSLIVIDFFKKDVPVGPPAEMKIASSQVMSELKEAGFSSFDLNVDLLQYQFILRAQ